MITTVRLDSKLENRLNTLAENFHKKKSDIIREAIKYYADSFEDGKQSRMQKAISKTSIKDFEEYKSMEGTLDDSL